MNKQRLLAYFAATFSVLAVSSLLYAQESAPPAGESTPQVVRLSPEEAVERAIQNNLGLESSRIGTETKRRAANLSWNQFIPNVTIGGSLMKDNEKTSTSVTVPVPGTGTPMTIPGVGSGVVNPDIFVSDPIDVSQWRIAGSLQVSLSLSVAMIENMNRLRLEYQGGLITDTKVKLQLERDVRKAYNNMLLLQENGNLMKENYEAAQRRMDLANANYRAGLAPELTLLQAQVATENMKPAIDQIEHGIRLSMAQFAMFLGMPYDTVFEFEEVDASIPLASFEMRNLVSQAASSRPDIQELRHSILTMKSARRMQIEALFPSLTFSWNSTPVFLGDPGKDSWSKDDLWKDTGSMTISLGLRLHSFLPFSTDFQAIKNLDDQMRIANIGLAQMIQGTEIEIYGTIMSLERTYRTAEALAQTVSLAERSYRLTEDAYRAGLQDLLQVQNAELELRQAKVAVLEQQFNYVNSLLDLEYAIGVPFGTLTSGNSF